MGVIFGGASSVSGDQWSFRRVEPEEGDCTVAGSVPSVRGLMGGTQYTYRAYDNEDCSAGISVRQASVTFTTPISGLFIDERGLSANE